MRSVSILLAAAIISTTIGSGCAGTQVRYVAEPIPLPAHPVLPRITEEEANEIRGDVWRKIEERDRKRRQYAEELEAEICATWPPGECPATH
jgi:hypothetical protein